MKKFYLGALSLPLIALCACSFPYNDVTCEGEHIIKEFNLKNSEKLECENIKLKDESKCKINLHEGDSKKVVIDAQESLFNSLKVEDGSTLTIKAGSYDKYITDYVTIDIYGYSFKEIELSGALWLKGDIGTTSSKNLDIDLSGASIVNLEEVNCDIFNLELSGASAAYIESLTSNNATMELSGASVFDGMIVSNNFTVDLSGASKIEASGSAANLEADLSGSSVLFMDECVVGDCDVDLSGASVGHLNVTCYTKGNLSGASYLYLSGSGKENVSTSGSSFVYIN